MGHAIATFDDSGQSTTDDPGNPHSFKPGMVDVALSDAGGFEGAVQLRRRFVRSAGGARTDWEVVKTWTQDDFPVHAEFWFVDGFEWQLYCAAHASGACDVRIGN